MKLANNQIDLSLFNYYSPEGESVDTKKFQTYSSEYFVRNADGSVTFIAPAYGSKIKHTANSSFARSETRETLANGDDKEANWKLNSKPLHIIYQDFAVNELAKSKKMIIGQVHGDSTHPPYKNQITDSTIYVQLRRKLNGTEDKIAIVKEYKLNTRIQLQTWFFADGRMKVFRKIGNGWEQVITDKLLKDGYQYDVESYKKDTWYGKWGSYSQNEISENDSSQGRGVTTYWDFGIQHLDTIPQYEPGQEPVVVAPVVTPPVVEEPSPVVPETPSEEPPVKEPIPTETPVETAPSEEPTVGDTQDPYAVLTTRFDGIKASYEASLKLLQKSIKTELNKLTEDMKSYTDKDKLAPIYTDVKAIKVKMDVAVK